MSPDREADAERRFQRSRLEETFRLLGHDCPLGRYPAPVVPIGLLGDRLVAVYRLYGDSKYPRVVGTSYVPVAEDAEFVHYGNDLLTSLETFDHVTEGLFAESAEVVRPYRALAALSHTTAIKRADPFVRLSLAAGSGDVSQTTVELAACVQFILDTEPDMAADWYRNMTRELLTRGFRFPLTWKELLNRREGGSDLLGWDAISQHLAVSVDTAQRWAAAENVPVHGGESGDVYCSVSELDEWVHLSRLGVRWYEKDVPRRSRRPIRVLVGLFDANHRSFVIGLASAVIVLLVSGLAMWFGLSVSALQLQSPMAVNSVTPEQATSAPIKSHFIYTVSIRNDSSRAGENVELLVQAPSDLQLGLLLSDVRVSARQGDNANTLFVRLSRLDPGELLILQFVATARDRYVPQSQLKVLEVRKPFFGRTP